MAGEHRNRTPRRPVAPPLTRLATRQHGVVAWWQLVEGIDLSEARIRRLVEAGHLVRIHHGVYAVGHLDLAPGGRWMAAVLACGRGARLSHGDGAALRQLRRVGSGPIHVTAAGPHRVPGVCCHVTRHPERLGRTAIDGIPVTTLERTVLDLAPTLHPQRLRGLLEAVQRADQLDPQAFAAMLAVENGHHGVGRLREALRLIADVPPRLNSDLEELFLALIRAAGLPEPSVYVLVHGQLVDFRWADQRVIVELDSWRYHRAKRRFETDRSGGNRLALAGETLLRFTDLRVNADPDGVIAELAEALGLA